MELTGKSVLHLVVLAHVAQIGFSQHWSYGWLPGGKRSAGDTEAKVKMMDSGDLVTFFDEPSPFVLESLGTNQFGREDGGEFTRKRKWMHQKRII
ncbi:gonadotropin-releasing hormone 3 [Scleropages formosus]|uniref:Progonadoliberin n=1 Tax=Scleropages formosus TaxID=113540 RepID=A0A8C9RP09_SCLFO|nr:progonadoliberin-3-like [Scleropages formosus]